MGAQGDQFEQRRDAKAAWDEVGARFADLGRVIKERQQTRTQESTTSGEGAAQGEGASSGEAASPDTGPARQVIDAVDEAFTALGDAVRDSDFQRQAKGSLDALGAALGVTFAELGEHLRERFEKPKR